MIGSVRELFLFEPTHGLDSYLSKRVRHGSIVGFLRSPAEKSGVIWQQGTSGAYVRSDKWIELTSSLSAKAQIDAAIESFSRNIDTYLLRLKDTFLHVKTDKNPHGIFDAKLATPFFHLIRSVANQDTTLQAFVNTLLASLWGLLNPSLISAKQLIQRDASRYISDQFERLRERVSRAIPQPSERLELDRTLNSASMQMQSALGTVAAWFEPLIPGTETYSINEVVDIALASVKAVTPNFAPHIEVKQTPGRRVEAQNLPIFIDVLFIALHNVARWSGCDSPQVDVYCSVDLAESTITLRIENEISATVDVSAMRGKLTEVRARVETGQGGEMLRREGGSGLYKLAGITSQSSKGRLNFDVSSDRSFLVEVTLSLLMSEV
jgi:hypothetical protein